MSEALPRWWEAWPGRLEAELEAFRQDGLDPLRDEEAWDRGRLVLRVRASVAPGEERDLVVVYPDTFPHCRVAIYAPGLELVRHANPFGENLCVLPRASEHWRPSITAAELVRERVPDVVAAAREGRAATEVLEDPQGEPFTDYYEYWRLGAVLLPGAVLRLDPRMPEGRLRIRMRRDAAWLEAILGHSQGRPPLGQALLLEVSDDSGHLLASADADLAAAFAGPSWEGRWVRMTHPPMTADADAFVEAIHAARGGGARRVNRGAGDGRYEILAAVFPEEVREGEHEDAWVFCVQGRRRSRDAPRAALLRGMRVGAEDFAARIPELQPLRERTVAVVGLGALGAPLAQELARAQLGELRLLDHDIVDAAGTVRWPLGLAAAGPPKVLVMADWIWRNYPFTRVVALEHYVGFAGQQTGSMTERQVLARWATGAHLLIDASAEENVSRVVSEIGRRLGIPQLYLWSVEGYGGVIARLRPGQTGCMHCLELALGGEATIAPSPPTRSRRVQPRGCADPTFTGADVDLLPVSVEAARLAMSTLCGGVPNGYPPTTGDVLSVQLRSPDGHLLVPPRWSVSTLSPDPRCPLCTGVESPAG